MKTAYFHCFAGISGDMILGALVDAGLAWEQLLADLGKLNLPGYSLAMEKVRKQGISGTKVHVQAKEGHVHRNLDDIKKMITDSDLPDEVKAKSIEVFTRLAIAEAKVHLTTVDHVHFHEVGAVDAIVDIVGAAIGIWRLGIEKMYASPVHTGIGFTQSAHGLIPVPAPATLELLKDVPIYSQGIEKELTTPTGAAILTTYCQDFGDLPPMRISSSGYGAGDRELPIPNLLRLSIGEIIESSDGHSSYGPTDNDADGIHQGQALMMEANIDDMNPEFYDYLINKCLQAGAMDVFLRKIQMKKNRPAIMLSLLIHPYQLEQFYSLVFAETTTIGVRVYPVTKYMLSYKIFPVETKLGLVRVKVAYYQGSLRNIAPEYEDCRRLAEERNLPLKDVYDLVKRAAYEKLELKNL